MKFPISNMHFQNHSLDLLSRGRGVPGKCGEVYNRKMTRTGPGLKASSTKIDKFLLGGIGNNLHETDLVSISVSHFLNKS